MPYYSEYAAERGDVCHNIIQLDDQSEDSSSETSATKNQCRPRKTQSILRNQPHPPAQTQHVWVWHREGRSDSVLGRWLDLLTGRGPAIQIESRKASKDIRPISNPRSRGTGDTTNPNSDMTFSLGSGLGTGTSKSSSKSGTVFADTEWQSTQNAQSAFRDSVRRQRVQYWLQREHLGPASIHLS
ncbi:hypothetical protein BC567DRAFT_33450 [Phyllosticta citribraziliensis]